MTQAVAWEPGIRLLVTTSKGQLSVITVRSTPHVAPFTSLHTTHRHLIIVSCIHPHQHQEHGTGYTPDIQSSSHAFIHISTSTKVPGYRTLRSHKKRAQHDLSN